DAKGLATRGNRAEIHLGLSTHLRADFESQRLTDLRYSLGERMNPAGACADVVQVLAISMGDRQVQLMEAGAAAEDQFVSQIGFGGQLDDEPAQEKVVLNLRASRPRRADTPCGNSGSRNHRSGSTVALTITFQV